MLLLHMSVNVFLFSNFSRQAHDLAILQRAISSIEARLRGVVVGVPLPVEGQARRLIADAVSLDNLGKMYIWWMPWF